MSRDLSPTAGAAERFYANATVDLTPRTTRAGQSARRDYSEVPSIRGIGLVARGNHRVEEIGDRSLEQVQSRTLAITNPASRELFESLEMLAHSEAINQIQAARADYIEAQGLETAQERSTADLADLELPSDIYQIGRENEIPLWQTQVRGNQSALSTLSKNLSVEELKLALTVIVQDHASGSNDLNTVEELARFRVGANLLELDAELVETIEEAMVEDELSPELAEDFYEAVADSPGFSLIGLSMRSMESAQDRSGDARDGINYWSRNYFPDQAEIDMDSDITRMGLVGTFFENQSTRGQRYFEDGQVIQPGERRTLDRERAAIASFTTLSSEGDWGNMAYFGTNDWSILSPFKPRSDADLVELDEVLEPLTESGWVEANRDFDAEQVESDLRERNRDTQAAARNNPVPASDDTGLGSPD